MKIYRVYTNDGDNCPFPEAVVKSVDVIAENQMQAKNIVMLRFLTGIEESKLTAEVLFEHIDQPTIIRVDYYDSPY